jgi:hypothetical protein
MIPVRTVVYLNALQSEIKGRDDPVDILNIDRNENCVFGEDINLKQYHERIRSRGWDNNTSLVHLPNRPFV